MSVEILNPFDHYQTLAGAPIDMGKLYIGVANLDPQTNPIAVFYDEALTIAAPQPLTTSGGYVWRSGAPARIFTASPVFSAKLLDKNNAQVFYSQSSKGTDDTSSISVKDFGAVGDGVIDDTAAIIAALTFANSKLRTGIALNVKNSGCTLVIPDGKYNLSSLAAPLIVQCDIESKAADFIIPASYAQVVWRVGLDVSPNNLTDAVINLPATYKATGSSIIAGSTAVRLLNLNASKVYLGRISYFDSGLWCGGIGEGTVYNDIWVNQINYCKRAIVLKPETGGWCNSNRFYGGNIQQSTGFAGGSRVAGWRHLLIDGRSPATAVVGNTFIGTAWEGDASEYVFEVYAAYNNTFVSNYHETGASVNSIAITSDTITKAAHGLIVGDKMFMSATTLPSGMSGDIYDVGYYVVSVVDADNFKVSLKKGGTAIAFGGGSVSPYYILAGRFVFDAVGSVCFGNTFINWLMPTSITIDLVEKNVAYSNGLISLFRDIRRSYNQADTPLYAASNFNNAAAVRPLFAAHPPLSDPRTDPKGWSVALSDRGLIFGDGSGGEAARLFRSGATGALKWQSTATGDSSIGFDLASCTRSPASVPVTALSCAANARTTTTITLTGAAVGDHLTLTPRDLLPEGVVIAWSRINAANTVQIAFQNLTGATIGVTCNFQIMATRPYY